MLKYVGTFQPWSRSVASKSSIHRDGPLFGSFPTCFKFNHPWQIISSLDGSKRFYRTAMLREKRGMAWRFNGIRHTTSLSSFILQKANWHYGCHRYSRCPEWDNCVETEPLYPQVTGLSSTTGNQLENANPTPDSLKYDDQTITESALNQLEEQIADSWQSLDFELASSQLEHLIAMRFQSSPLEHINVLTYSYLFSNLGNLYILQGRYHPALMVYQRLCSAVKVQISKWEALTELASTNQSIEYAQFNAPLPTEHDGNQCVVSTKTTMTTVDGEMELDQRSDAFSVVLEDLDRDRFKFPPHLNNIQNLKEDMKKLISTIKVKIEKSDKAMANMSHGKIEDLKKLSALLTKDDPQPLDIVDKKNAALLTPFFSNRKLSKKDVYSFAEDELNGSITEVKQLLATWLHDCGKCYEALEQWEACQQAYTQAVQIAESCLPSSHPVIGTIKAGFSMLYEILGNYKCAKPLHIKSLNLQPFPQRWDHPHCATTFRPSHYLGKDFETFDRHSSAHSGDITDPNINLAQETINPPDDLTRQKKNPDSGPLDDQHQKTDTSSSYTEHQHDYNIEKERFKAIENEEQLRYLLKSLQLHQEQINQPCDNQAISQESTSPNRSSPKLSPLSLVHILIQISVLYKYNQAFDESEKYMQMALDIVQDHRGVMHTFSATLIHQKALIAFAKIETNTAIQLSKQALSIKETLLGSDHLHVALIQYDLAVMFVRSAKIPEALYFLKECYQTFGKLLDYDHIIVTTVRKTYKIFKGLLHEDLVKESRNYPGFGFDQ